MKKASLAIAMSERPRILDKLAALHGQDRKGKTRGRKNHHRDAEKEIEVSKDMSDRLMATRPLPLVLFSRPQRIVQTLKSCDSMARPNRATESRLLSSYRAQVP